MAFKQTEFGFETDVPSLPDIIKYAKSFTGLRYSALYSCITGTVCC